MAYLEGAIYSRLSNWAGLVALVGEEIHRGQLPENASLPAVTFAKFGHPRVHRMGGDAPISEATFEVNSWALSDSMVLDVAAQVRAALQGWRGTEAGFKIAPCDLENESDDYEPTTRRYRIWQQYTIWHSEV